MSTENDSDSGTTAGTACCGHLHANCFGPLATDVDSDSEPQFLVDSSTACSNVNNPNSNDYFDIYVYNGLRKFDRNGKRCISIEHQNCCASHMHVGSNCSSQCIQKQIIPDSGATAHMCNCKADFEPGSYVACSGVFVLMGNGSKVPVAGYGVSRIEIDGRVIRLENSLHVLSLDSNLFSTTHGTAAMAKDAHFFLWTRRCT